MLQKLFGFDPAQHSLRTEIFAGITTFFTMAYILAVNPGIFSALEPQGMPTGAVFTATILASAIGTLVMAFYAKKPFGLAPGMGINAFFVFGVCLGMGHTWQFALTAVFIEGIIFILLSLFKIREMIAHAIPVSDSSSRLSDSSTAVSSLPMRAPWSRSLPSIRLRSFSLSSGSSSAD